MSPRRIVTRCRELGLGLIAICDHNSAENAPRHARGPRVRAGRPARDGGLLARGGAPAHALR